jgi:hypothetical protein
LTFVIDIAGAVVELATVVVVVAVVTVVVVGISGATGVAVTAAEGFPIPYSDPAALR